VCAPRYSYAHAISTPDDNEELASTSCEREAEIPRSYPEVSRGIRESKESRVRSGSTTFPRRGFFLAFPCNLSALARAPLLDERRLEDSLCLSRPKIDRRGMRAYAQTLFIISRKPAWKQAVCTARTIPRNMKLPTMNARNL
jgi:hypothetical protein